MSASDFAWDLVTVLLVIAGLGSLSTLVLIVCGVGDKARNKPGEVIRLDDAKRQRRRAF